MEPRFDDGPFCGRVISSHAFAGLQLVDGVYPATTRVPTHSHRDAVFCVGLTGLCSETFAGRVRQYRHATVEFLPPEQSHALEFPFADTRAFSMQLDNSWIERAREVSAPVDHAVYEHGGLLSELMMKIYHDFSHPDCASPLAIQGLALEMVAAVSRRHSRSLGRQPQRWLARSVELLREGLTAHVTVTQLASAAGVHPVHLAREFRRFHGCTIGEYIRRLRVERACRQLSSSDESLAAIAASAGFSDQSHLSRTFKRLMGMTPTQYRRQAG